MAVEITSPEELKAWLEDKPDEWAQVIALRCALRVLPLVADPSRWQGSSPDSELTKNVFRAVALSSGAMIIPPDDMVGDRAYHAYRAVDAGVAEVIGITSASDVANVAFASFTAGDAAFSLFDGKHAADAAASAAEDVHRTDPDFNFWSLIAQDCAELVESKTAVTLLYGPLWAERPDWFEKSWSNAAAWLSRPGDGFKVWREWYYGRLEGLPRAFKGFNEEADSDFYRWLTERDNDWWDRKDIAAINADISAKIEELRIPPPPSDEELVQNPRAITFGPSDTGQVGLRYDRNSDEVDHTPDAQDRHSEILSDTRNALESSQASNTQARDIERPLTAYLEALGETLMETSPSLLIARGEKLRRLIALREDAASFATPFSEAQHLALHDWQTAHNLLVGLDPYLAGIERVARGPDVAPVVIDLDALKGAIQSAANDDIPTKEAEEALLDTADNVPAGASTEDRRHIQAIEAFKNFIRGIGSTVKKYGWKAIAASGGSAYVGALWVQRNIEWLKELFVSEPSILGILEKIASLPL